MRAKNPREAAGWDGEQPSSHHKDRQTPDCLFNVTYEELRRLAATVRRDHPNTTLNPTALVNEAWLKLSKSPEIAATSLLHFKRIAAQAMRQVWWRLRVAGIRISGAEITVTFDEASLATPLPLAIAIADPESG